YLESISPAKGRFRSFILASVKHLILNESRKARAQKRGGGASPVPLDTRVAEALCGRPDESPERVFERAWALTLLSHALNRLRADYERSGKKELFETLKPVLTGEDDLTGYAELAPSLGMTEPALKVAVHRLRNRYQAALRDEISNTVMDP